MAGKREAEAYERMGEALDRVDQAIHRLLRQGLQRVTRSSVDELAAVAQTAHAAGMIRVERDLEALKTHIGRYLDADPLFRTADLLATTNRIWLVCQAARRRWAAGEGPGSMVDLLGEARRRYEEVEGRVELQPVAASGWVTDTGYLGITVHLLARFESGEERLLQASAARPSMYFGADPRVLLHQPVGQGSLLTVFEVAHEPMTLHGPRISHDGRLGLGGDLQVGAAPDRGLGALGSLAVEGWASLVDRLREREVGVLDGGQGVLCYVEPARWGRLVLDDKQSRARMPLTDRHGAVLWLQVRLAPHHNQLVDNLGRLTGGPLPTPRGLVGIARAVSGELRLQPFTAVYDQALSFRGRGRLKTHRVHLGLVDLERASGGAGG